MVIAFSAFIDIIQLGLYFPREQNANGSGACKLCE